MIILKKYQFLEMIFLDVLPIVVRRRRTRLGRGQKSRERCSRTSQRFISLKLYLIKVNRYD